MASTNSKLGKQLSCKTSKKNSRKKNLALNEKVEIQVIAGHVVIRKAQPKSFK